MTIGSGTSTMAKNLRILRCILWICIIAASLFTVADSCLRPRHRQVDFFTYYTAAQTWARGETPYDVANLSETAGEEVRFPFIYPPVALPFFYLFTVVPFGIAAKGWVGLKLVALAAL